MSDWLAIFFAAAGGSGLIALAIVRPPNSPLLTSDGQLQPRTHPLVHDLRVCRLHCAIRNLSVRRSMVSSQRPPGSSLSSPQLDLQAHNCRTGSSRCHFLRSAVRSRE